MTSRELVKAALQHKETTRVPYAIYYTPKGLEKLEKEIFPMTGYQYSDNDIIRVSPPWWRWFDSDTKWQSFDCPDSTPKIIGTGSYNNFFDSLKILRDNTDKYILASIYAAHWEKAHILRGFQNFITDMGININAAKKLLAKIIDTNLVMLDAFLSCKEIDGVLLGSDWGSQLDLIISPEYWKELIMPGEKKMYDLIHGLGKDVWVHSCGNIQKIIPDLIEIGVDVLNPIQPEAMDIYELKERYGKKITFWGGLSTQDILPFGSIDEVKNKAYEVCKKMSKDGGYIFGPSQEIQEDVKIENVLALVEIAKRYTSDI